jgi:hypothetical protein
MRKTPRTTVRRLYREAIMEYQGCGDKEIDTQLIKAIQSDVHLAGRAPGGWVSEEGILEIYCENGIRNASDFWVDSFEGQTYTVDNIALWQSIDDWVNLALEVMGRTERVFHEPHNSAVIAVHWS